ncbi:acyl-CoA-binding domain-containing protein 6-like isoform X2 [Mya arenaria]|uniref:acyl-CoA-binding domain-containing protein 6-like isoform X2 n=1 Tax=Mya arenaria TaxID=6604 RepID=UPI0022E2E043|nr:acyl-CoA-binding domain-containing protein 6-like isoform X2 [Mya arenaria]
MESVEKNENHFDSATEFVRSNSNKLGTETLLYLYARYKQVKEGTCNVPKPGFLDFQGKQKWEAWKKLGNMTKEKAMKEYVKALTKDIPDWSSKLQNCGESGDSDKPRSSGNGLGVSVSTMQNDEEDLDDELKTVFDWCKEGDVTKVANILKKNQSCVNLKDDEGMVLLHWAADRGDADMVHMLLSKGASVDKQDDTGQTALHYGSYQL